MRINVRHVLKTSGWVILAIFLAVYIALCLLAIVFLTALWLIE